MTAVEMRAVNQKLRNAIESAERAAGYFTTNSETDRSVSARTSGTYLRADPQDLLILDGRDDRKRADLIYRGTLGDMGVDQECVRVRRGRAADYAPTATSVASVDSKKRGHP
jgi:hypothetical protein